MVFANEINASGSVEAVMAVAVVDVVLTLAAVKSRDAAAGVVARCVLAAERVSAQLRNRALVHICTLQQAKRLTQSFALSITSNHRRAKEKTCRRALYSRAQSNTRESGQSHDFTSRVYNNVNNNRQLLRYREKTRGKKGTDKVNSV